VRLEQKLFYEACHDKAYKNIAADDKYCDRLNMLKIASGSHKQWYADQYQGKQEQNWQYYSIRKTCY